MEKCKEALGRPWPSTWSHKTLRNFTRDAGSLSPAPITRVTRRARSGPEPSPGPVSPNYTSIPASFPVSPEVMPTATFTGSSVITPLS